MKRHRKLIYALFLCCFLAAPSAHARREAMKSQTVIDFEDEVVEGMNRRPLDSLNQISEKDKRKKKPHLYRKRVGFRTETTETLRALRFTP